MIPQKEYEELLTVRDKDKDMKFFIKEAGGKISELVMVLGWQRRVHGTQHLRRN